RREAARLARLEAPGTHRSTRRGGPTRLRVSTAGHCKRVLHRRAADRASTDACDASSRLSRVCARTESDQSAVPKGQDDPPGDGQPQYALREGMHCDVRTLSGPSTMASIYRPFHAQARELVKRRGTGSQPTAPRVSGSPSHSFSGAGDERDSRLVTRG